MEGGEEGGGGGKGFCNKFLRETVEMEWWRCGCAVKG